MADYQAHNLCGCGFESTLASFGNVAQLVEHSTHNAGVAGSTPAVTTKHGSLERFSELEGLGWFNSNKNHQIRRCGQVLKAPNW